MSPRTFARCVASFALVAVAVPVIASFAQDAAPKPAPAPAQKSGHTGRLTEDEFAKLHELSKEQPPAPKGVEIKIGDNRAYLSLPEGAQAPLPGVVVIHEWWGLNGHVKHWTDRLAAEGYAAVAVDMYRGKTAETQEDAGKFYKECVGDREHMVKVLTDAEAFLRTDARVKAPKTGSVGWCLGGRASQLLAMNAPELDACAIYYGGGMTTDKADLAKIKAPVLGIFGKQDGSIPLESVDALRSGLTELGVRNNVLVYDAAHGFANPSGKRYDRVSAGAAWDELVKFFAVELKGEKPASGKTPAESEPKR
ncbi:MAG: dienelactone hydrolase family protein [Planctomycetota bacterium]|nr:MAG: dienelactone hydrolase family protein [Planctomycetota bacterium]